MRAPANSAEKVILPRRLNTRAWSRGKSSGTFGELHMLNRARGMETLDL
jgi:hypothetical protein